MTQETGQAKIARMRREGKARTTRQIKWIAVAGGVVFTAVYGGLGAQMGWEAFYPVGFFATLTLLLILWGIGVPFALANRPNEAVEAITTAACLSLAIGAFQPFDRPVDVPPYPWEATRNAVAMVVLAAVLLPFRNAARVLVAGCIALLAQLVAGLWLFPGELVSVIGAAIGNLFLAIFSFVAVRSTVASYVAESTALTDHSASLDTLAAQTQRMAEGDLSTPVVGVAPALQSLEQLRAQLRALLDGLGVAVAKVDAASSELQTAAALQATGAQAQASAIAETVSTVQAVKSRAVAIEHTASAADQNAASLVERTARLVDGMGELVGSSSQIQVLLSEIRDIAYRSEILAINAALEGTRAGDAGRGFALIAAQMQALSVRVRVTVGDLDTLNATVSDASHRSQDAMRQTQDAVGLAIEAIAAIRARSEEQRDAAEDMAQTIAEIAAVTDRFNDSSGQLTHQTQELSALVLRLADVAASSDRSDV